MDDDRALSTEARLLLRHAILADLKTDANELAGLVAELDEPLPTQLAEVSKLQLLRMLRDERDRARKILALVVW